MRKLLLLPLLLLLVACGAPAVTDDDAAAPNSSDEAAVEVDSVTDDTEQAKEHTVDTGTTPAEAAIIREQDQSKGASDPLITIIEYGDFQ